MDVVALRGVEMNSVQSIYISLLTEGVDVWKPVQAEHLHDNVYRIVNQPYNRAIETWQFEPGDEVECQLITTCDGEIFAAVRKFNRQ